MSCPSQAGSGVRPDSRRRGPVNGSSKESISDRSVLGGFPARAKWPFIRFAARWGGLWGQAGTAILRENVLSMAAGSIGAWWTGRLSVFWRAQIVGWGLFFLVDLVNRV